MGHIFFITPSSPGSLDKMSQWTLRWLLQNDMADDATMYTCNSIEDAQNILETALIEGESPALIVFDHADRAKDVNLKFSKKLHEAIPESWIVEIVPDDMPVEKSDGSLYWIRRPADEDEWNETLEQVLLRTPTPQWAET